jgi:chromosomal replication initiator protein
MENLTLWQIETTCAKFFDVEKAQLNTRRREVVEKRQILHYFAKNYTRESLSCIGRYFGNKDHATVLHSERVINNLIGTDRRFALFIFQIKQHLLSRCMNDDDVALCLNGSNYDIKRIN